MTLPFPESGLVISYAYLWHAEHQQGHEEGRKDRPCAIVMMANNQRGETVVTVVPITHTPPENPDEAIEIPLATKKRLRLDDARSWAVVSEINRFIWPGSDLRPISRRELNRFDYGYLPPRLFQKIKERLAACAKAQRLKAVHRTE